MGALDTLGVVILMTRGDCLCVCVLKMKMKCSLEWAFQLTSTPFRTPVPQGNLYGWYNFTSQSMAGHIFPTMGAMGYQ